MPRNGQREQVKDSWIPAFAGMTTLMLDGYLKSEQLREIRYVQEGT